MAKLYFRYGTMDSAKSMNLLAVAHNYRKQGKKVLLVKPRLDTRFGATKISSRCGLEADADMMVEDDSALDPRDFAGLDCVLVDEAQFLPPSVIEDLRRITVDPGVPVIPTMYECGDPPVSRTRLRSTLEPSPSTHRPMAVLP